MFGGLSRSGIERLIAKEIVRIFKELAGKRNQWSGGHSGYVSEEDQKDTCRLAHLGYSWSSSTSGGQSGHSLPSFVPVPLDGNPTVLTDRRTGDWNSLPFQTMEFLVGDSMLDGNCTYSAMVRRLPCISRAFVQLRASPRRSIHLALLQSHSRRQCHYGYQYGPESEVHRRGNLRTAVRSTEKLSERIIIDLTTCAQALRHALKNSRRVGVEPGDWSRVR